MALYPCPECKREISTDAKNCPNCGKDVRFSGAGARWKTLPKSGKFFVIFAILVLIFSIWVERLPKSQAATPALQAIKSTPSGPLFVQSGQWFGFRDRELLERATKIVAQGDKGAWSQLMAQGASTGALVPLKQGEEVFIEDVAMMAVR